MANNASFDRNYESYTSDIWVAKLVSQYEHNNSIVFKHLHKKLVMPQFAIDFNMGRKWGEWDSEKRLIRLNANLFRYYEFEAVKRVLKHEMGHQIVSEIFGFHGVGCSHGEHWKLACAALEMENPTRCDSMDFLSGLKGKDDSSVADRIRKILVKANDGAVTKEESQIFLNKAQELMMRHQISMKDLMGTDRLWVKRPVGEHYERFPHWLWDIGGLLTEFYSVKTIKTHSYTKKGLRYYLELFGEPDNVDIAEYVFYAIFNNGQELFEKALAEHNAKMKSDPSYASMHRTWKGSTARFTLPSFMRGLVKGFKAKLMEQRKTVEVAIDKELHQNYSLVATSNEKLLDELYGTEGIGYGRIKHTRGTFYRGAGNLAGNTAGRAFSINHGVRAGNGGRLINA